MVGVKNMTAARPDLYPTFVPARLATAAVSRATQDALKGIQAEADKEDEGEKQGDLLTLEIPHMPTKLLELHRKLREVLDPDTELITDDQIASIIHSVGTMPHRVVLRCLVIMEATARLTGGGGDLLLRVRSLRMKFSNNMLMEAMRR